MAMTSPQSTVITEGCYMTLKWACFLVATSLLTSCAGSDSSSDAQNPVKYAHSVLKNWGEGGSSGGPGYSESIPGLMPNVVYHYRNGDVAPASQFVVLGTIVDVAPGAAYAIEGSDNQVTVDFNDPDALWRIIRVHVSVRQLLARQSTLPALGETVTFNLAISAGDDFAKVREGLVAQPLSVFFLTHWPQDDLDSPLKLLRSSSLMLTVGPEGQLNTPLLSESDESQVLGRVGTLAELKVLAGLPRRDVTYAF